ncbi:acyltransferase family protein [Parahaliea sp. F7430]|uniref:Acyltransferase family protein n=1 Tax=Sediminihaliea albiluteola TaxID=2758564 RepID=A0A7W2TUZ8_9GAMM|nr:lysophospholipid acyltransferase family protein [Sediminihaliea albiluteola]MBA6412449.1 acyltransferase family protein [Sediminihaliea albiluteola]
MSKSDSDNDPLSEERIQEHIEAALSAEGFGGRELDIWHLAVKKLFNPMLLHSDRVPEQPCLFVGNHSLFALDGFVISPLLAREIQRPVRPLADRFLWGNDKVAKALLKRGIVMGHPAVCDALMEHGEDLIVFPGGAHEAVKPASAMYELQWKERYGFVRLAAKHGYTIMPFGIVGPDEFYDHWIEGDEIPDSRLGQLLQKLGVINEDTRPDMLPPIPRGSLGTMLPRPQRCFMGFGQPIDLSAYAGKKLTKKQQQKIRAEVANEIETQLAELLRVREQNRRSDGLLRRLLTI